MYRPVLIATVLALAATTTAAQVPPDSGLASVKAGQWIRIRALDGSALESRVVGGTPDRAFLMLRLRGADTLFPTALIDSLWIRGTSASSAAGVGALIGALAAGVGSFLFLRSLCGAFPDGDCDFAPIAGLSLVGAAAGAGAGILIGSSIGGAVRTWRLSYVREHPISGRLVQPNKEMDLPGEPPSVW